MFLEHFWFTFSLPVSTHQPVVKLRHDLLRVIFGVVDRLPMPCKGNTKSLSKIETLIILSYSIFHQTVKISGPVAPIFLISLVWMSENVSIQKYFQRFLQLDLALTVRQSWKLNKFSCYIYQSRSLSNTKFCTALPGRIHNDIFCWFFLPKPRLNLIEKVWTLSQKR